MGRPWADCLSVMHFGAFVAVRSRPGSADGMGSLRRHRPRRFQPMHPRWAPPIAPLRRCVVLAAHCWPSEHVRYRPTMDAEQLSQIAARHAVLVTTAMHMQHAGDDFER